MLHEKRIAVLGVGKMGEALIEGLCLLETVDRARIVGTTRHRKTAEVAARRLAIPVDTDNAATADGADICVIAVKPRGVEEVCREIGPVLSPGTLVISIAASVTTDAIEEAIGRETPVIRVMPNTPCLLGEGMSVICPGRHARDEHVEVTREMFRAVGRTTVLDEPLMDAATGLSGSGPAYIYLVIEALAEGGVKAGIPREKAIQLAAQSVKGAASMVLEEGEHPALLKDVVTTPAGCTVDGLLQLEEGGVRVALIKAVVEATRRAKQLVEE